MFSFWREKKWTRSGSTAHGVTRWERGRVCWRMTGCVCLSAGGSQRPSSWPSYIYIPCEGNWAPRSQIVTVHHNLRKQLGTETACSTRRADFLTTFYTSKGIDNVCFLLMEVDCPYKKKTYPCTLISSTGLQNTADSTKRDKVQIKLQVFATSSITKTSILKLSSCRRVRSGIACMRACVREWSRECCLRACSCGVNGTPMAPSGGDGSSKQKIFEPIQQVWAQINGSMETSTNATWSHRGERWKNKIQAKGQK